MATTNSYDYTVTRDNIITDALLYLGILGEGESASSAQLSESARVLNNMLKAWAAEGVLAWTVKRGYILPVTGVSSITTVSHICTSYVHTNVDGAAASGASTIDVDSISGIAASDQIGIEQSDGTMQWTTVSGSPSGSTITLATTLSAAVADGADVYTYTASSERLLHRPLHIYGYNILTLSDSSSYPITGIGRTNYYALGDRTTTGTPNQVYYDDTLGSATADPSSTTTWYGEFFIYPRFTNGDVIIEFDYQRPLQDLDAASDNVDIPQEFYLAATVGLAALLGPKYGVSYAERVTLLKEARMYLDQALWSVVPMTSIQLQPDMDYGQ